MLLYIVNNTYYYMCIVFVHIYVYAIHLFKMYNLVFSIFTELSRYTTVSVRTFSSLEKETLYPITSHFPFSVFLPLLLPCRALSVSGFTESRHFIYMKSYSIQSLALGFFYLTLSGFIYVVACISTSFLFKAE